MELIIILVLIGVVVFIYKDYKYVIYLLGCLELFFRLIHYIGDHVSFIHINGFINKFIPDSLFSVVGKYTSGTVEQIVDWVLIVAFIFLLVYLVKYLFKIK